ncbi:MAG: porin [Fimbriimonadales bacterium]|nr:porin [Fimbriimonadales bacterium]
MLFAGQANQSSSNLPVFNQVFFQNHNATTSASAEQIAGARLEFDAVRGENNNLTIGATYFAAGIGANQNFTFFQTTTLQPQPFVRAANIDRVDVLGADLKAKFAGFTVNVEYAQSNFLRDTTNVLDEDNWALNASVSYDFTENLGLTAGYLEVRPYFAAPGAWGRVGYLYNPSDLRGFYAAVRYKATDDLSINLQGAFLEGTGRVANGYSKNDEVTHVVAGVDYRLTEQLTLSLNYEGVFWKLGSLQGSPEPVWNYFTLGASYSLGENTALNVLYQLLDTDGKRAGVVPAVFSGGPAAGRKNSGAVAATTLSIKF